MIMEPNHLPLFKVGQLAESKSFIKGYRSAWFRCKVNTINYDGPVRYHLEYFDYPDETIEQTEAYQKPPQNAASNKKRKMELMMRPSFPLIYRESQMPDFYPPCNLVAVVSDTWKVGDLVDWWSDHCYWSGRVVKLLENEEVQIQLPDPPIGEGKSYEACCKDLRPSLDWSPENGWTVPLSREGDKSWHCARLIQQHCQEADTGLGMQSGNTKEGHNCMYELSNSHEVGVPVVHSKRLPGKYQYSLDAMEKGVCENRHLTSLKCETIESSVIELEELANRIRWLKGVLQFGFRWSNAMKPSWRVLDD